MLWILFLALAQKGVGAPEKRQADEQVDRQDIGTKPILSSGHPVLRL